MEGELGPNVLGSSSVPQSSHELSDVIMSPPTSLSAGDTKAHDAPVLALTGPPSPTAISSCPTLFQKAEGH